MSTKAPVKSAGTIPCVAIDLGATAVRVVEVEWSGGARIAKRGSAPLPANVWNNLEANRDAVVAAIKEALASAGIVTRMVAACLPRRLVTLRFARLPHTDPDQLETMVMLNAQEYIPMPIEDVVLGHHLLSGPLDGDSEDMQTVLLVAARRPLVIELLAIFDKAGLEVERLSVSALALAEHAKDALDPTALLDLEPGEMDVAVVSEGRLLYTRASVLDLEGAIPEVAERRLAEEVARSFTSYQNDFRHKPLSHVYLSGPSVTPVEATRIETTLSGLLEMPVSQLQSRLLPASDPDARTYATAAGMALQTLPGSLAPINLVPNERTQLKVQRARRQQQVLVGVGLCIVAVVALVMTSNAMKAKAEEDKKTAAANKTMTAAVTRATALKKPYDQQVALAAVLEKGLDRNHPTVDVLVALNSAMPRTADIWLTQMTFDRGGIITLRGETKTATAATDLVLELQKSGAFVDVRLGYLGDAQENTGMEAAQDTPPPAAPVAANITPLPNIPAAGAPNPGAPNPGGAPNPMGNFPAGFNPGGNPGFTGGNDGGAPNGGFRRGGFRGGYNGGNPGGNPGYPGGNPGGGFNGGAPGAAPGGAPIIIPGGPAPASPGVTFPGGAPPIPLPPTPVVPPNLVQNTGNAQGGDAGQEANDAPQTRFYRRQRTPGAPGSAAPPLPAKTVILPAPGGVTPPKPGVSAAPTVPNPAIRNSVTPGTGASSNKVTPVPGKTKNSGSRTPLTSFTITCRVNSRKAALIPAGEPGPTIKPAESGKKPTKTGEKSKSETAGPDDEGEPDAN